MFGGVVMEYAVPKLFISCFMVTLHFTTCAETLVGHEKADYSIIVEPQWQYLEDDEQKNEVFGKWVFAGKIVLRKKSKETVHISELHFTWKGQKLSTLFGSLYKKDLNKKFLPLQDVLISDSKWNKRQQRLVFDFEKPISLGPTNIFYLVLTVPEKIEDVVKEGLFFVEPEGLPSQFQEVVQNKQLALAFNDGSKNTSNSMDVSI